MRFFLPSLLLLAALTLASVAASAASGQEAAEIEEEAGHLRELLDKATEADDDDDADSDDVEEAAEKSDDDDCHPEPRTETKRLGGKEVTQTTVKVHTKFGCKRVLQGGSADDFTEAENCAHCRKQGKSGFTCMGPPLAVSLKCRMVRGPDCRMYAVSHDDSAKACPGA